MTSVLENYIFSNSVAGFPLTDYIIGEKRKLQMTGGGATSSNDHDGETGTSRFEGLVIPVGLVSFSNNYLESINHTSSPIYKTKTADVIPDELFDTLFKSVSKEKSSRKKATTQKKKSKESANETKRQLPK